jgi:hypothetical protein
VTRDSIGNGRIWQRVKRRDRSLGGSQALNLPDGNRVHFEPIDCLIRFGKRWRGDASEALVALGLEPPRLDGDQL